MTNVFATTAGQRRFGSGAIPYWIKYQWNNAAIVALGANLTGELTVATLPAKTLVLHALVVITGQGAGATTLTVSVGPNGSETAYVLESDAKAAANTVYGDAIGDVGAALSDAIGSLPSYTATTVIKALFTTTVENLDDVTGSSGDVLLQVVTLP